MLRNSSRPAEQEERDDEQARARGRRRRRTGSACGARATAAGGASRPRRARPGSRGRARAPACRRHRRVTSAGQRIDSEPDEPSTTLIVRPSRSALPGSVPTSQRRGQAGDAARRRVADQQRGWPDSGKREGSAMDEQRRRAVAGAASRPRTRARSRPRARTSRAPIAGRNDIRVTWPRRETRPIPPASPPSASTPARSPTRRPARSSRRSTRPPPTCRRGSASTRASSTAARRTRPAWRSRPTSRPSRPAAPGFAFASGMAAIDAVLTRARGRRPRRGQRQHLRRHLPAVRAGAAQVRPRLHLRGHLAARDRSPRRSPAQTKYLFMETPTNPMLSVTDIAAASEIAHRHGVRVVVDNTFASPYVQRPLDPRRRHRHCTARPSS